MAESGGVQLYHNLSPLKFIIGELICFYHIGTAVATDNIFGIQPKYGFTPAIKRLFNLFARFLGLSCTTSCIDSQIDIQVSV
jgi:hypothetical protein